MRMERVRDEDKSGKKSKGRWSEGGRQGNAWKSPALSGKGCGVSTCSQSAQGRQAPCRGPERKRGEQGASSAPAISRASCRGPRCRRGALLGPRLQQIAAVLQYPHALAPRHWHHPGLGNSCTVPMVTRQLQPPPTR